MWWGLGTKEAYERGADVGDTAAPPSATADDCSTNDRGSFCEDIALFFDAFDVRSCRDSSAGTTLFQLNAAYIPSGLSCSKTVSGRERTTGQSVSTPAGRAEERRRNISCISLTPYLKEDITKEKCSRAPHSLGDGAPDFSLPATLFGNGGK